MLLVYKVLVIDYLKIKLLNLSSLAGFSTSKLTLTCPLLLRDGDVIEVYPKRLPSNQGIAWGPEVGGRDVLFCPPKPGKFQGRIQ